MDTGIISLVLRNLPYDFNGRNILADLFYGANVVLWLSLFVLVLVQLLRRPIASLQPLSELDNLTCLPAISISLTTIYEMIALTSIPWSHSWQMLAYVLFWINTFLAVFFAIIVLKATIEKGPDAVKDIEPTFLLTGIAALTNAAGGGLLANKAVLSVDQKVPMIVVSYFQIGFGLALALLFTCLVFIRLYQFGGPPNPKIPSVFVTIGPWGQASFAFFQLGQAVSATWPGYGSGRIYTEAVASAIGASSLLIGIILYGVGFLFFIFAVTSLVYDLCISKERKNVLPWSLACWSFIFPIGVWTSGTEQLALLADSGPLRVWATVLVVILVLIWLVNITSMAILSLKGEVSYSGALPASKEHV